MVALGWRVVLIVPLRRTVRVSHGASSVTWKPRPYRRWLDPMVRECGYAATPIPATPLTPARWEAFDHRPCSGTQPDSQPEGKPTLRSRRTMATRANRRAQPAAKSESTCSSDRKPPDGPTARPDTNRRWRREVTRHPQPSYRDLTHLCLTPERPSSATASAGLAIGSRGLMAVGWS